MSGLNDRLNRKLDELREYSDKLLNDYHDYPYNSSKANMILETRCSIDYAIQVLEEIKRDIEP